MLPIGPRAVVISQQQQMQCFIIENSWLSPAPHKTVPVHNITPSKCFRIHLYYGYFDKIWAQLHLQFHRYNYLIVLIQAYHQYGFVNYKKGCTLHTAASDKVYQLPAHGRWFSPGTPTSSTNKTDRHDIAEILLKVALNTKNQIKSYCPLSISNQARCTRYNIM